MTIQIMVLKDMTPCSLVGSYHRFGGIYCHCILT